MRDIFRSKLIRWNRVRGDWYTSTDHGLGCAADYWHLHRRSTYELVLSLRWVNGAVPVFFHPTSWTGVFDQLLWDQYRPTQDRITAAFNDHQLCWWIEEVY